MFNSGGPLVLPTCAYCQEIEKLHLHGQIYTGICYVHKINVAVIPLADCDQTLWIQSKALQTSVKFVTVKLKMQISLAISLKRMATSNSARRAVDCRS